MAPRMGRLARPALAGLIAALAACAPAGASLDIGSPAIGVSTIRFRDERLRSAYGNPVGIALSLCARGPYGLAPALMVEAFWKSGATRDPVLGSTGRTNMLLLPIMLRLPFERTFGGRLTIGGGPLLGWSYIHEQWNARLPEAAGIDPRGSGEGGWLGAGVTGEAWLRIGRLGSLGIEADQVWGWARRATVRGNPQRKGLMEAGWSAFRLGYAVPWSRRP